MSANPTNPSPAMGPDILARYLHAFISARKMNDLERPWGLGDGSLEHLWSRLLEALTDDPEDLNRMIAEVLNEKDRQQIIDRLAPLIFALPMRVYPMEVRAVRSGSYFIFSLKHFALTEEADGGDIENVEGASTATLPAKLSIKKKNVAAEEALGFLPSALATSFATYLREQLNFEDEFLSEEVIVSSGGRRRRVQVSILSENEGLAIRFLERINSPKFKPC